MLFIVILSPPVRGQGRLIGAQIFGRHFQCEGRHDESSQTDVSTAFSSRYTWDANVISSGSVRKPVVTENNRKRRRRDEMPLDPDVN